MQITLHPTPVLYLRLPDEMIESMRSAYEKSTKFLETEKKGLSEDELKAKLEEHQKALDRQFREQLLMMVGFTKEEIESQNLLEKTTEEIQQIVRDKLSGSLLRCHERSLFDFDDIITSPITFSISSLVNFSDLFDLASITFSFLFFSASNM